MPATALLITLTAVCGGYTDCASFHSALPVWPEGRETEMNLTAAFRADVEVPAGADLRLRLTASCIYRAFVNGAFLGHGPARACRGYFRVDEWDLTGKYTPSTPDTVHLTVAIEVASYNANSYYLFDQPGFLQAEILADAKVIASTAGGGAQFEAAILPERVQKVQRFSFQRPFIEVYRLSPGSRAWRTGGAPFTPVACAVQPAVKLLPRRVPYPRFECRPALQHVSEGTMKGRTGEYKLWKDRSLVRIGPELKGYPEAELETIPSIDLQHLETAENRPVNAALGPDTRFALGPTGFHILDLGTNFSGFIGATVTCDEPCRFLIVFDEVLSNDDVNFRRMGCAQVVTYELEPGTHALESIEPYTMRYVKLISLDGRCTVQNVHLRTYANPAVWEAHFACSDNRLSRLFDAGRETFAQNAVDVFMDCPSRERAGWLCDSFFTARSAFALSGDTTVERNFVENFLLPETFPNLPEGMLPMCYPSDHYDGNFIPNWALWFVVQLEEYVQRSGDTVTAEALKPRILALFDYFKRLRNADGLLQDLEGWVFVEWSAANRFVQDVNYPSNMLFAQALECAGRLYGMDELTADANRVRNAITKQSWDGEFWVDNANIKDGKLEVTRNRTEVCQYFAFYFGLATPETHPELWRKLVEDFGPDRKETRAYKEIHPANSFIGNMLRFELLSQQARGRQILDESIGYLLYMADRTGTLWENVHAHASCNHGFASHIVYTLYRDVLGIQHIDPVAKRVKLRFTDVGLDWCRGRRPLGDDAVTLEWRLEDGIIRYTVEIPTGYALDVENLTGRQLIRD